MKTILYTTTHRLQKKLGVETNKSVNTINRLNLLPASAIFFFLKHLSCSSESLPKELCTINKYSYKGGIVRIAFYRFIVKKIIMVERDNQK